MSSKNPIISLKVLWGDKEHSFKIYPKSPVQLILETENSFHITFSNSSSELVINKHNLVMWETRRTRTKEEALQG